MKIKNRQNDCLEKQKPSSYSCFDNESLVSDQSVLSHISYKTRHTASQILLINYVTTYI